MSNALDVFQSHRRALFGVAYRMLGSIADAEDALQDSFVRWAAADHTSIECPAAFLRQVVTRVCLDHMKKVRRRREDYIGPWLPEPAIADEETEDVTLPLLVALERLSPLERAAFLLHDVFGEKFEVVARVLNRDVAACRQLAHRARENVQSERPRFPIERGRGLQIAEAFFEASRGGNLDALSAMLASDVSLHVDGGGKRPAAGRVLRGRVEVEEAIRAVSRIISALPFQLIRYAFVNGLPGFVTREADGILQTTALWIDEHQVKGIYIMRNPEKLEHLDRVLH